MPRHMLVLVFFLAASVVAYSQDDADGTSLERNGTSIGLNGASPELDGSAGAPAASGEPLELVAFGSCNRQYLPQPHWSVIGGHDPDLWIWMGDNIYADTSDMEVMREKYEKLLAHPGYRRFLDHTPVIGTWDDHDYGRNNAGKEYPKRAESQELLLDFLDVSEDSPRRTREGVYGSYGYGPPGRRIKIILLDTRYHRDRPGPRADILGEKQWSWLEHELRATRARINLLVSSIQVIPEDHDHEKWANFPAARARLFNLISRTRVPGLIILSGDRHIAEISRYDEASGYPLYEVTSSGLTHTWLLPQKEYNRHRVGELVIARNFGLMEIDWSADPVRIDIEIRDRHDDVRLHERIELPKLRYAKQERRSR